MEAPAVGWAFYGLGARAINVVVFMIGPLLLIDAARAAEDEDDGEGGTGPLGIGMPRFIPTTVPQITITIGLLAQCVAAPVLATIADRYGTRRILMTGHAVLGIAATIGIGSDITMSVLSQAGLLATLYYAMAMAWMFHNSLLPSVASVSKRPTLSLASTAISNLGGAFFLVVLYRVLSDEPASLLNVNVFLRGIYQTAAPEQHHPHTIPVSSAATAVLAAAQAHAAAHAPSVGDLHLVCLLAAGWWLLSATPAVILLSFLKAEPIAPPVALEPEEHIVDDYMDGFKVSELSEAEEDETKLAAKSWGLKATDEAGADVAPVSAAAGPPPLPSPKAPPLQLPGQESAPAPRRRRVPAILAGFRRLRRHKHASRFVCAQVLYLTAVVADGTAASSFAREVVGLNVTAIIRLTIYAALAGAVGSIATMALARCVSARLILGVLMVVPPLLLLYTSLILEGETELLIVGMIHAFVAGGVGFQGLNRGVFAQMVPKGREAEFFGVYFVLIKAFSWVGPLACAVLNEATGSLRTAILSALIFYIPAILVLATTDFDEAQREAEAASHTPRVKGGRPSGAQRGGALNAGPHERLLPPTATYGTTSSCPPVPSAFSEVA